VRQSAHAATWALLGLVVAVLLAVTAIGLGGIQEPDRGPSARGWPQLPVSRAPATYAVPDPAPFAGRLQTPALLVVSRSARPDHLASQVRRRSGIVGAEPIGLASLAVMGRTVTAAAIDPASYRRLADADTARTEAVWDAVARGDLTITHGIAEGLGLDLGGTVVPGPDPSGPQVPVGAIATTVPGIDLVVNRPRGDELGIPGRNAVVVSLGEQAVPDAVRRDLQRALGRDASITDLTETQPSAGVYAARLVGGSVADAVGSFRYRWFRDGTVAPDPAWVGANIATGEVPILGQVTCHRVMLPQLRAALQAVVDAGLASAIDPADFGGCYSPRFIERDPRRGLSLHTWGIAVDLNVSGNQVGTPGTMDPRVVRIFESWGFAWGGRWSRPDPMHFELAALAR
jgi:hypothetical protein